MATIKAYTNLSQSKNLANILSLESADMYYINGDIDKIILRKWKNDMHDEDDIPCWSFAVLLNILAKIASEIDDDGSVDLSSFMGQWSINMFDCPVEATDNYDNPIDACVTMIEKLNEQNLL